MHLQDPALPAAPLRSAEPPSNLPNRKGVFSHHQLACIAAASLALTFAVLSGTVTASFLADDFNIVEAIRSRGAFANWCASGEAYFRPLVSLLYFLDLELWGLNPRGFHLTNLLLHALNGILVVVISARITTSLTPLNASTCRELALIAGLIFLVHPSHMEPIAWIAGRSDLLVTVFALASISSYLRWRVLQQPGWRIASLLALAAALCSKEAALAIPLVLFALETLMGQGQWRPRIALALRRTIPYMALLPLYLLVRWQVLGALVAGRGAQVHLRANPALLLDHLFHHFSRALIPRIVGIQLPAGTVALLGIGLAGWIIFRWRRKLPKGFPLLLACAVSCFALAETPVLNLVVARVTTRGERLIYFPSAFAALFAAVLFFLIFERQERRRLAVAILTLTFTVQLALSAYPWRQAAMACESIRASILETPTEGRRYLVGLPDSIGGAYAFQGGLHAALELAGRRDIRPVIVNFLGLPKLSWKISAQRRGNHLTVYAEEHHRLLRFRARRYPSSKVDLVVDERYRHEFDLRGFSSKDRIFVFSEGRLQEVLDAPAHATTAAGP